MNTKRRTKGEGSITQLSTGKYRVRVDCGYVAGKRKWLSAVAPTITEARKKLRELLRTKEDIVLSDYSVITFKKLTELFIEHKRNHDNLKESSIMRYQVNLNRLCPFFRNKLATKVTTKDIDNMIDALRNEGLKERTISGLVVLLSVVFNYAIRTLKIINTNPTMGCQKVNKGTLKPDVDVLTIKEHEILRNLMYKYYTLFKSDKACRYFLYYQMYVAYSLAYETGMREGEIAGLKWSAVDFEKQTIYVNNQIVSIRGKGLVDSTPKTNSSNRIIYISEGLLKVLKELHEIHSSYIDKPTYVLCHIDGKPWAPVAILTSFKRYLQEAKITRHFTFHMIRHTNATRLIELTGNDYKTVSERLGHSNVAITLNVYSHFIEKNHKRAATLMDGTV